MNNSEILEKLKSERREARVKIGDSQLVMQVPQPDAAREIFRRLQDWRVKIGIENESGRALDNPEMSADQNYQAHEMLSDAISMTTGLTADEVQQCMSIFTDSEFKLVGSTACRMAGVKQLWSIMERVLYGVEEARENAENPVPFGSPPEQAKA